MLPARVVREFGVGDDLGWRTLGDQMALIQEKSIIRDLLRHAGVALWFPS